MWWVVIKRMWLVVWINSCCGYFLFGELLFGVICWWFVVEFGLILDWVDLILLGFCYWVVMVDGIVENEICFVY